jgi:hypothetical protein
MEEDEPTKDQKKSPASSPQREAVIYPVFSLVLLCVCEQEFRVIWSRK